MSSVSFNGRLFLIAYAGFFQGDKESTFGPGTVPSRSSDLGGATVNLPSRRYVGLYMIGAMLVVLIFSIWMAIRPSEQNPWECLPHPGYCDTDTDNAPWRR
jgi:hypothetical protein